MKKGKDEMYSLHFQLFVRKLPVIAYLKNKKMGYEDIAYSLQSDERMISCYHKEIILKGKMEHLESMLWP